MDRGANPAISTLLSPLLAKTQPTPAEWQALIGWELSDCRRAQAWGLDTHNVAEHLQARLAWLKQMEPWHPTLPLPSAPMTTYLPLYWQLWLPLAMTLKQTQESLQRPLIQGILGGQGTGKTTLTKILRQILAVMGSSAIELSLDDVYKPYAERVQLRRTDPRLRWRGPPGTHDVDLALATLDQLRTASLQDWVDIPRFDKSLHGGEGDRVAPERVRGVDIVLFEGWFVGVRPVAIAAFDHAPDPIRSEADRQFAREMNRQLQAYLPLWQRLDRLLVLIPEDYRVSQLWRRQAEQRMRALGKSGLSDVEIDEFVEYFWRALHPDVFITPLKHQPEYTDLVIEIRLDRTPSAVYNPK